MRAVPMRSKHWFITLFVAIALAGCFVWSSWARSPQNQAAPQLFSVIQDQNALDQTPDEQSRLALLRQLPSTQSIELVRLNQTAASRDQFAVSLPGLGSMSYA